MNISEILSRGLLREALKAAIWNYKHRRELNWNGYVA